MIIAIDGPAASGKGTIGRLVAEHYHYHHLDTGLLYRAVAATLLERAAPIGDEAAAIAIAEALLVDSLDEARLGTPEIGNAASHVATLPGLRAALMKRQRDFAARKPGSVLVGRDIGTIVCPEADAKIYLTASLEARGARRAEQLGTEDWAAREAIIAGIRERDHRDMSRPLAPLRQAADARLLDTTDLDIEASFRAAVAIVDQVAGRPSDGSG
jgi:cytidylate kinase